MSPRQLRSLRGTAVASVATLIAATAHTLGGGGAPAPLFILALAVLCSPVAVALIGRRLSRTRTVLAVGASQLLFHAAFAIAGAVPASAASPSVGHAHDMSAMIAEPLASGASAGDSAMLVAHAAAAALTAVLVLRAERVLRAVARGVRRFLRLLGEVRMPRPERPRTPLVLRSIAVASATYRSDVSRRGPPVVPARG